MSAIDWGALSRLVPEVALVLIFMWYTRERDKATTAAQKERDDEWRGFMREERSVREQLLKEERQARAESTARIADEVKGIATLLSANQALLIQHDSYTRLVGGELLGKSARPPGGGP